VRSRPLVSTSQPRGGLDQRRNPAALGRIPGGPGFLVATAGQRPQSLNITAWSLNKASEGHVSDFLDNPATRPTRSFPQLGNSGAKASDDSLTDSSVLSQTQARSHSAVLRWQVQPTQPFFRHSSGRPSSKNNSPQSNVQTGAVRSTGVGAFSSGSVVAIQDSSWSTKPSARISVGAQSIFLLAPGRGSPVTGVDGMPAPTRHSFFTPRSRNENPSSGRLTSTLSQVGGTPPSATMGEINPLAHPVTVPDPKSLDSLLLGLEQLDDLSFNELDFGGQNFGSHALASELSELDDSIF